MFVKVIPLGDFVASGGLVAQDQFCQTVEGAITVPILSCNQDFLALTIVFQSKLDAAQEAALAAIVAAHTATGRVTFGSVADLTEGLFEGEDGFATNGLKVGESPGAGTGVPIYWSTGAWRVFSTDAAVQA